MKSKILILIVILTSLFTMSAEAQKLSALPILTTPDSSADYIPIVHAAATYKVKVGKLFHEFGGSGGGSVSLSNTQIGYGTGSGITSSSRLIYDGNYFKALNQSGFDQGLTIYINSGAGEAPSLEFTTGNYLTRIGQSGYFGVSSIDLTDHFFAVTIEEEDPVFTFDNVDYVFPTSYGDAGSVLVDATGSGDLAWGGVAGAAGDDGEIQFNDDDGFAADPGLWFDNGDFLAGDIEGSRIVVDNSTDRFVDLFAQEAGSGSYNRFHVPSPIDPGGFYYGQFFSGSLHKLLLIAGSTLQFGDIDVAANGSLFTIDDANSKFIFNKAIQISPFGTSSGNTSETRFLELAANGTNYSGFKSTDSRSGNLIYTLPSTDPTSGQVLSAGAPSSGVSALSWATPSNPGDAAADASTKGVATFAINDFNSSAGLISIDYTNGQAATTSAKGFLTDTDWDIFNNKVSSQWITSGSDISFTGGNVDVYGIAPDYAGVSLFNIDATLGSVTLGDGGGLVNGTVIKVLDATGDRRIYFEALGGSLFNSDVTINNSLFVDVISEKTAAAGVTIDGVLLKDGLVLGDYGGTGVNNSGKTITLGGNLTTSGANALTFTTVGATNVTLPTSGTLVTSGVTTLSSLTSIGTIGTGTWQGSVIAGQYGGTGVANTGKTITVSGNTTIGSSTNTVAFATSGNTSVTLPTSGTLATLAGTETLTGKSIVATQLTGTAYTFGANNTSGTAAYTLQPYEDHALATYAGTVTFNSTPPSSITVQQYAWSRIGNTVTLFFSIFYGTPGTTNTSAIITLPSDCPTPAVFAGAGDAASEYAFPISGGRVEANMTGNPSAIRGGLRQNSSNNGWEVALIFGSVGAAQCQFTLIYRTN